MKFGSVCSGIEAASLAWESLGWKASWFAEIDKFPSAVLAYRFPDIPNLGDITLLPNRILSKEIEAPDILCGGTPCQAFSLAGKRQSLEDARGNLSLIFTEIADAIDEIRETNKENPSIIIWENVPGVLSTRDNAFGCFLAKLVGANASLEPSTESNKWPTSGYVAGPKGKQRGESLMLNISECLNDVEESLLSQVLEKDSIPQKFFLSPKACKGILSLTEKKGKPLDPVLKKALEEQSKE